MAGTAGAAPNDDVFTVGNYPVDADAANAVAAKQKAMAEGQQAAFRSLLKRLVPVTSYDRLKRLSALKASGFLEGVAVRSERNSPTRYIASLDFSFRADSVRTVLQQEGIPFIEEQARDVIIVPVVRNAEGAVDTGAAARAWTDAWKSLDLEHTLTPFSLQTLKSQIHTDTLKMAAEGRGGAERILAGEYASPYVVLAIADPDPATKRLNVTLSGIDAVGGFTLRRSLPRVRRRHRLLHGARRRRWPGRARGPLESAQVAPHWRLVLCAGLLIRFNGRRHTGLHACPVPEPGGMERDAPPAARSAGRRGCAHRGGIGTRCRSRRCAFRAAPTSSPPPFTHAVSH